MPKFAFSKRYEVVGIYDFRVDQPVQARLPPSRYSVCLAQRKGLSFSTKKFLAKKSSIRVEKIVLKTHPADYSPDCFHTKYLTQFFQNKFFIFHQFSEILNTVFSHIF